MLLTDVVEKNAQPEQDETQIIYAIPLLSVGLRRAIRPDNPSLKCIQRSKAHCAGPNVDGNLMEVSVDNTNA
jgi:hypothetical protein